MKGFLCLLFIALSVVTCAVYKETIKTTSKCIKKKERENIDGTFACMREAQDIYVPYFGIKNYTEAIKNNRCAEAKRLYKKYSNDKKFVDCHKWWNVELI